MVPGAAPPGDVISSSSAVSAFGLVTSQAVSMATGSHEISFGIRGDDAGVTAGDRFARKNDVLACGVKGLTYTCMCAVCCVRVCVWRGRERERRREREEEEEERLFSGSQSELMGKFTQPASVPGRR